MIKRDNRGFSIIEVVFILIILLIIFSIVIVTYPKLISNMRIRSDKASASYIAKALRGWYIDSISDPQKEAEFSKFISDNLSYKTVKLSELADMGVGVYLDSEYQPYSMVDAQGSIIDGQCFCIGMIGDGIASKFIITVETDTDRLTNISNDSVVNYDGTSIGVIYIES